jgi:two-component system, sensor histidine kinase LadS
MKKSLLCLVSLLFAFVATSAFGGPQSAAPPFVVSSDAARFGAEETRPQVQYFYDENNRLHLADVLKDRSKFTPSKGRGDTLNFGYVEGTLWLTFEIKNAGPEAIDLVLLYDYPPMQTLDFHFVGDDGAVRQSVQTGRLRPFDERALWHRSFAFPLHLAPFEIGSVFLRLQTSGSLQVPLQILTKDQFSSRVQREYLGFGIYYGFVILMLIYSVFAFNSIRDKNYLFYAAYIASVTFAQLCLHGLAYQFLWPASPEWNRVCILVFVGLSFVSLSIFTMNFLGTKTSSPVIHRVLVIYAAAAILTFRW